MEGLRRLRRKTTVGALAVRMVMAQAVITGAAQVPPQMWQQSFFDEEDLQKEDLGRKKKVYLVTLPHPRRSLENSAADDLKRPGHCI